VLGIFRINSESLAVRCINDLIRHILNQESLLAFKFCKKFYFAVNFEKFSA